MPRKEHHVVPNKNGWGIKKDNGERSVKNFDKNKMQLIMLEKLVEIRNLS